MLSLDVDLAFPEFSLTVRHDLPLDGTTAIFGPSGCGKSTLLRVICGLEPGASGRVAFRDEVWQAPGTPFVPPHRRGVGYVFQDARLFSHLTVEKNLRYAHRRAVSGGQAGDFARIVDALDLGPLLKRRPPRLSGGERQRVAIGRTLLSRPRLLLMDEPLSSLDEKRKAEILPYLERLRDETDVPIIYVSHSVAEVSRLARQVVVLADGTVAATGATADIFAHLDMISHAERGEGGAVVELELVDEDDGYGLSLLRSAGGEWRLPRVDARPGDRIRVRVRARDVMVSLDQPRGVSALNVLQARVSAVETGDGPEGLVTLDCGGDTLVARITRRSIETLGIRAGKDVFAVVKAATFDAAGDGRGPTGGA